MCVPSPTRTGACATRVRHLRLCVTDASRPTGSSDSCLGWLSPDVLSAGDVWCASRLRPPGRGSRVSVCGRTRLCVRHGQTQTAPPGFESAGGAVGWAMSRPTVLDRTRAIRSSGAGARGRRGSCTPLWRSSSRPTPRSDRVAELGAGGAFRIRASSAPPRLRSWGRDCPSSMTWRIARSTTERASATDELPRLVDRKSR